MMIPRFLDIEASSLDKNSFPIEVAWSDSLGNIESHLINPYAIDEWTDWDYNAQQIHGLSRKTCREQGKHPKFVCDRLSECLKPGDTIYADGLPFDEYWIDALYGAGSKRGYAHFWIKHSDNVMLPLLQKVEFDDRKRLQLYENLKIEARRIVGARHRAEPDVLYLIELWKMCLLMSKAI